MNLPKTKSVSCWTVLLTFSALTSHEDIFLGKPKDFKAFNNSFGLPMHSINLFSKSSYVQKMSWWSDNPTSIMPCLVTLSG